MKERDTKLIIVFVSITVLVIGILFWPTLYRYDKFNQRFPVRINRLTGYTEVLTWEGWSPMKQKSEKAELIRIPDLELDKLEAKASIAPRDILDEVYLSGDIYNGSSWIIRKLKIRVRVEDKSGETKWDREFNYSTHLSPLSTGSIFLKVAEDKVLQTDVFQWGILEAFGYKESTLEEYGWEDLIMVF